MREMKALPTLAGGERVMIVCSTGGHLAQLHRLRPWFQDRTHQWVTFQKADAVSLLAGEDVVWAYHPTTRNIPNLIRNLWLAFRTVRRFRPDIVLSNGAGVAVPFFLIARLVGARTIFYEVYDRIDTATLTGRLCYPISDLFLLQWDEQQRLYPKGQLAGRLL